MHAIYRNFCVTVARRLIKPRFNGRNATWSHNITISRIISNLAPSSVTIRSHSDRKK